MEIYSAPVCFAAVWEFSLLHGRTPKEMIQLHVKKKKGLTTGIHFLGNVVQIWLAHSRWLAAGLGIGSFRGNASWYMNALLAWLLLRLQMPSLFGHTYKMWRNVLFSVIFAAYVLYCCYSNGEWSFVCDALKKKKAMSLFRIGVLKDQQNLQWMLYIKTADSVGTSKVKITAWIDTPIVFFALSVRLHKLHISI